jgi:septum formation protein
MAREKALHVFKDRPQEWVLGADTIVVIDNAILGKPADETDAARMLRLLSGRTHEVITGVCVVGPKVEAKLASRAGQLENRANDVRSETTLVTMKKLSEKEITDYIATGEPMDKAGAYAIQGHASRWIPRVEGDYNNVVGLPVNLVKQILAERKLL